jgi:hypothetical protein
MQFPSVSEQVPAHKRVVVVRSVIRGAVRRDVCGVMRGHAGGHVTGGVVDDLAGRVGAQASFVFGKAVEVGAVLQFD